MGDFDDLMGDTITVIKLDGQRFEGVKASVQPKVIMTMDTSIPFEAGDIVERKLPNDRWERFEITDPAYVAGFPGDDSFAHYNLKYRRAAPRVEASPAISQRRAEERARTGSNAAVVDLAIVTILPSEFKAILGILDSHAHVPGSVDEPNLYSWESGTIRTSHGEYSVVVALAGDPTVVSGAIVTEKTVQRFQPRYVVVAGIAGGFAVEGQQLGDVVVSRLIYCYEYGKIADGFQPRHDFTHRVDGSIPNAADAIDAIESDWWKAVQAIPPTTRGRLRVRTGGVASGNKVVDSVDDAFFASVLKAWPRLIAVEMEGAGAAFAIETLRSQGREVGLAMVRGISDMPGVGVGKAEREAWRDFAAEAAAKLLLALVRERWPIPPLPKSPTGEVSLDTSSVYPLQIKSNADRDALRFRMLDTSTPMFNGKNVPWWRQQLDADIPRWLEVVRHTVSARDGAVELMRALRTFEAKLGRVGQKVDKDREPELAESKEVAQSILDLVGVLMRMHFS